ncbi:uncharacterized protein LOC132734791 [Ruditapes philippinarum]|uniref:uncharacterized protein LOC132734791 n=1 Tax=Ruditapes philippinarum TaxID=129788 RepID=UPI00295AB6A8|nr:uncharacterized protein LOC132734791 [Ruditapes philippinarum]
MKLLFVFFKLFNESKMGKKECVTLKCIVLGILKFVCLYKGLNLSKGHLVFKGISVVVEIISLCCLSGENRSKEINGAADFNGTFSFVFNAIATMNSHYNDLKDIKDMCTICFVVEAVLIFMMFCCCSEEEKRHKSTALKETA